LENVYSYKFEKYYLVDGKHPSIAFATTGGKVLIHSPYAN